LSSYLLQCHRSHFIHFLFRMLLLLLTFFGILTSQICIHSALTLGFNPLEKCNSFTFGQCKIHEDDLIEVIEQITPTGCQEFCQLVYPERCSYFVFRENFNECLLLNKTLKHFLHTCKKIGGPIDPTAQECLDLQDPCKVCIQNCTHSFTWGIYFLILNHFPKQITRVIIRLICI
jgi:hypothetical protein